MQCELLTGHYVKIIDIKLHLNVVDRYWVILLYSDLSVTSDKKYEAPKSQVIFCPNFQWRWPSRCGIYAFVKPGRKLLEKASRKKEYVKTIYPPKMNLRSVLLTSWCACAQTTAVQTSKVYVWWQREVSVHINQLLWLVEISLWWLGKMDGSSVSYMSSITLRKDS